MPNDRWESYVQRVIAVSIIIFLVDLCLQLFEGLYLQHAVLEADGDVVLVT